ncbi:MAG: type II secretion system protein [Phycisphaerae bacterium]|jgi:prepilin-type N-terminal cleavage/methylation domain-containing protein
MTSVLRHAALSNRRAFSLVEVIATMVIVGFLGVVIASMVRHAVDGYSGAAVRAELLNNASAALERLVTGVRDIPLRASITPAEPWITSITANSISVVGNHGISLSGTNLQLIVAGVATTLVGDVSDFQVRAFDQSNAAMATALSGDECDPVRRLQFTLTLSRNGVSETVRTRVFLRCMMSGATP